MDKDLQYYLSLPYRLELLPMAHSAGGYYARYPELGAHGDGPTIEAAIKEADISKALILETMLEDGAAIPEPGELERYSGKFNVRVPKSLHRQLVEEAEREGVSLNMLIVSRLSDRSRR